MMDDGKGRDGKMEGEGCVRNRAGTDTIVSKRRKCVDLGTPGQARGLLLL
eukprot:GAFH01002966.1.p9 GENE.GAFH01002966.1~~GAFH01002966.1.p9  ORF type:complete len:50 (+),score=4.50 GAFH01002966.1:138-287(+)